jgi:hypothetical protein
MNMGIWCADSSMRIVGHFFKKENTNFQCYINLTLNTLLQELMGRKDLQLLRTSQCHGSPGQSAATCTLT